MRRHREGVQVAGDAPDPGLADQILELLQLLRRGLPLDRTEPGDGQVAGGLGCLPPS